MQKVKTTSSVKKRFRVTKNGKILRKKAFKSHILEKQTTKKKRELSKRVCCKVADKKGILARLPYKSS